MLKKIVAMFVICAMLVPLSPVVAADETTVTPTIEEILNSYHKKAFEAQAAEENGSASTYARGDSGQTLEQETVAELTAAGYEAYNVTGENYEELEETLNTDFAEMGLNPNSSYVVVISGEEQENQSNPNSRVIDPPTHEDFYGESDNTFTYTEDGVTYTMRYVTVCAAGTDSELFKRSDYIMTNINYMKELSLVSLDAAIAIITELASETIESYIPYYGILSTIGQFFADVEEILTTDVIEELELDTMVFRSATAWTRSYIQIRNPANGYWYTSQCSSYAISEAKFDSSYVYNPKTNAPQQVGGILKQATTYSWYYNEPAIRKSRAVEGYKILATMYDCTGDIEFYFVIPLDRSNYRVHELMFTHEESLAYLLPYIQEE